MANANANLLFYTNLSGELFYIIDHRMKSQGIKVELRERVFNDIAISICHPAVVQNIIDGSLSLLNMNMESVKSILDRIVHSSIMTINAYSLEKLFELTLIATRYQYTVVQHPNDCLLIALNHLDGIRAITTDPGALKLCENFHNTLVERFRGESSLMLQECRYAILTYLVDVKLKMANLIKLGFQNTSGEFVKFFPDKVCRKELVLPGTIELYGTKQLERSDSSSDSNNESLSFENKYNIEEESDDENDQIFRSETYNELHDYEGNEDAEDGCHFENIDLQIHDNELDEDDELLEIEFVENSFQEVMEQPSKERVVIKFNRKESSDEDSEEENTFYEQVPLISSFDLNGSRGIILGQSIYELPGNYDEGGKKKSVTFEDGDESESSLQETDLDADAVAVKAVHGLALCSHMLGCNDNADLAYKSPQMSAFAYSTNKEDESLSLLEQSSSCSKKPNASMIGVNIVNFDARTDRSNNKSALKKISQELDFNFESNTIGNSADLSNNVYDLSNE